MLSEPKMPEPNAEPESDHGLADNLPSVSADVPERASRRAEIDTEEDDSRVVERIINHSFSGPLPSPNILKDYDTNHPGFADKIMSAWQEESRHRHALERREIQLAEDAEKSLERRSIREDNTARIAILAGSFVVLVIVAGCIVAAFYDKNPAASLWALTGPAAIILAFKGKQLFSPAPRQDDEDS